MARNTVTCDQCGKNLQVARRYPIGPLAQIMGESLNSACLAVGLSGTTQQDARCHGVTRQVADRLATQVGVPAYSVWPEMIDHNIADHSVQCEECGDLFVPTRNGHRFCSKRCQNRQYTRERQRRLYQQDPEFREHRRQLNRATYLESAEYYRAAERRRYRENGAARRRERYWSDPEFRQRHLDRVREYRNRVDRESA